MKKNGVAFTHREKNWRCVYRTGKKWKLAPPGNSHCGQRTLQAWPGRYGAFSLLLFPLLGKGEKMVVVPLFDRVYKDWFDVYLCLWIVKTVVLPGLDMTFFCLTEFFHSPEFLCLLFSPDVRYFNFISCRFVFMGCLWGGPGSDFVVLLWSCPPNGYAVTMPKTWWSLWLHK